MNKQKPKLEQFHLTKEEQKPFDEISIMLLELS